MSDTDSYICLQLSCDAVQQELLMANLMDFPIEGYEQTEDLLSAFIPISDWNAALGRQIEDAIAQLELDVTFSTSSIEQQNWNAIWESSIEPIQAGNFYIHPSWNEGKILQEGTIRINIDPKMSFGTGHHASTRLCLIHLSSEPAAAENVLDMGTGTGVLAIAAALKGSLHVVAVDNDRWSAVNTAENVERNGVQTNVDVRLGSIEAAGDRPFDLILANINREILISMLPRFSGLLRPGGRLIMAGLLVSDQAKMEAALAEEYFSVVQTENEGEWWSVKAELAQ